jgi:hypothetical protein
MGDLISTVGYEEAGRVITVLDERTRQRYRIVHPGYPQSNRVLNNRVNAASIAIGVGPSALQAHAKRRRARFEIVVVSAIEQMLDNTALRLREDAADRDRRDARYA